MDNRSKTIAHLIVAALFLTLPTPLPALGETPVSAREELKKRNIAYTAEEFVQRAIHGDNETIELFLRSGMDPNTLHELLDNFPETPETDEGYIALADSGMTPLIAAAQNILTERNNRSIILLEFTCRAPSMEETNHKVCILRAAIGCSPKPHRGHSSRK